MMMKTIESVYERIKLMNYSTLFQQGNLHQGRISEAESREESCSATVASNIEGCYLSPG